MDLIAILKSRIDTLSMGDHSSGLKAVHQHLVVAARHLERGQSTHDDSAFTDAIYRTNQAFEGSLKEAYRVLASKDPAGARLHVIESYLVGQGGLKPRVHDEFANYRQQWRNPSTHDHCLDFDDDEALLAIVRVCAFAVVLIDQMTEVLAFRAAQDATRSNLPTDHGGPLLARIAELLPVFSRSGLASHSPGAPQRGGELVGALSGYLSSALGKAVTSGVRLENNRRLEADIIVRDIGGDVVIEVKQGRASPSRAEKAVEQLVRYMEVGEFLKGVAYFHPDTPEASFMKEETSLPDGREVVVLYPDH